MSLIITRIPALTPLSIMDGSLKLVVYNPADDKTYRTDLSNILTSIGSASYQWNSGISYALNDVVLYQDNFWESLQNGNLGNVPAENSFWHEVSKANTGLSSWQAGVYTDADVFVVGDFSGSKEVLQLIDGTRPFNSSDLAAELAAGKWVIIGDGGIDSVDTTAAPIIVNMKNQRKKSFKGSAAIATAKSWQFSNAANMIEAFVKFNITTVADQTMPVNFLMPNYAPWDSATRKWTPPGVGKYVAHFLWDGTEGTLEISGGF